MSEEGDRGGSGRGTEEWTGAHTSAHVQGRACSQSAAQSSRRIYADAPHLNTASRAPHDQDYPQRCVPQMHLQLPRHSEQHADVRKTISECICNCPVK